MSRTETFPDIKSMPRAEITGYRKVNEVIPFRKAWRNFSEQSPDSRIHLWNQMIGQYSGKQMSKPGDKLVAVAGLAHDLGQNWPKVDYLAGLWSYDLLHGFCGTATNVLGQDSTTRHLGLGLRLMAR
jgi:hypothetical protein